MRFFPRFRKKSPSTKNQAAEPIASARAAVKEQGPLRGAPLVPLSASLTARPRFGFGPSMGERCSPRVNQFSQVMTKILGRKIKLSLIERRATGYNI